MARKAKITTPFPSVGETWTCKNGDVRRVVGTDGPFIEWERLSSLFSSRAALSGTCDHRSWNDAVLNRSA